MNSEADILRAAIKAVGEHAQIEPLSTNPRAASVGHIHADGLVDIRFRGHTLRQPYEVKRVLNSATMQMVAIQRRESPKGLLVVAPYVNGPQAEKLREADIHFIDAAGNVFLKGGKTYVLVTGRRPETSAAVSERGRAFQPSGLKLLFAFLTDPRLDQQSSGPALVSGTYRQIASATGLPHSTIGWIMPDLIRQGYVVEAGTGTRMLVERRRLLERWVVAYGERLRPGLVVGQYQPPTTGWWKDAVLEAGLWSGEVAAAMLTGFLKPETGAIFAPKPTHGFILKHRLQQEPKGAVAFLQPFWREPPLWSPEKRCVHPMLVYADLLTIDDDRTREAAQVIYDQHLRTIVTSA